MNYFLIQAILIAEVGDQASSFWMQILVFLIAAVFFGVYSLIKNNRSEHEDQQQNLPEEAHAHYAKSRWRFKLPHKPVALRRCSVQKYIAKMKNAPHNIPNLSQESKLDYDSLGMDGQNPKKQPATKMNKDVHSGMDLLELGFMLSVVENTKGNDQNDVTMRKLNFNEVFRREKLSQVKSKALTVYAINQGGLYSKDIQCEAMGELAERTMRMNSDEAFQPAVYPRRRERKRLM